MRIIHTADWHLCDKLGRIDRTADLQRRVEAVAALCHEHDADVLIIAGDLFSEQAGVDEMTAALKHIREAFAAFFARGGTVIAITGNHDRDSRINLIREGMNLVAQPVPGRLSTGRFYLANSLGVATLAKPGGATVQFVLVPYPFASRYNLPAGAYRSKEEENRLLQDEVRKWIGKVHEHKNFDMTLPTVLAAHLHVRGSELTTAYKMTDRDDVMFQTSDLNAAWAYVALGHIHKPQSLGSENVRYSGSLDRLDFGETHTDHGVLMFDIDGAAAVVPVRLPLLATPFHTIELTDPETELDALAAKYSDAATAIVRITVTATGGALSRDEINRRVRKLFPRLHDLRWADAGTKADDKPAAFTPRAGYEATVRDYLTEQLAADPDKADVLALAEHFLKAAGAA